jgi:hypothetical protein
MKVKDMFPNTFKAISHELGHDRPRDTRPMWQRRLSCESPFCKALVSNGYMTEEQMQRAAQRYRLGMSRDGGVIFWQIDEHDVLHDGKIMYYRQDCHRDHDRKPTWVNYLLKRSGLLPQDFKNEHCLFGLHLLQTLPQPLPIGREVVTSSTEKSASKSFNSPPLHGGAGGGSTIAVVESEKTAVIMSEVKPEYLWMATGGKTELNVAKLKPLAGHKVILFPDTDETGETYREWYEVAKAATDVYGHPFTVSSILEQQATKAQKAAKIDIVDLIIN